MELDCAIHVDIATKARLATRESDCDIQAVDIDIKARFESASPRPGVNVFTSRHTG